MDVDMRREMVSWLNEHGHWGVVRVAILGQKCSCTDEETGEPTTDCTLCLGTGRAYTDHVVKMDKRIVTPDFLVDSSAGEVGVGVLKFYFERYVPVKRDDLILEVELHPTTLEPIVPIRIREAFRVIQHPEDMRDRGGRLEFIQVRVDRMSVR